MSGADLEWAPWIPLDKCWRGSAVSDRPGIYRIRHETGSIDYIGETGRSLRERLGALSGVYSDHIPFRDPHTAAPALWALRRLLHCSYHVSVAPLEGESWMRKGIEAREIARARRDWGRSPAANFGRMPPGFSISSYRRGDRRGCKTSKLLAEHRPGVPPLLATGDPVVGPRWSGHEWSPWLPHDEVLHELARTDIGIYRLRRPRADKLVYVGQGRVRQRLLDHRKKGPPFDQARLISFCLGSWLSHQRLEIEMDLIGDHTQKWREPPCAQFRGNR